MKLVCISAYRGSIDLEEKEGAFRVGEEIHVDDETAAFLMRNSPGSFEVAGAPRSAQPPAEPPTEDLSAMTVDALRALAAERGVALGQAKAKADIIAVLQSAAARGANRMQTGGLSR